MSAAREERVQTFLREVIGAMGLALEVQIEETPDGPRINLHGDDGGTLLARRGEPLQALQHLVDSVFRTDFGKGERVLVDCMGFRRDKDLELRQMAKFLVDKAKSSGVDQQIGPLNAYERRLVHLTVADDPDMTSESIGDAALKTVIISVR